MAVSMLCTKHGGGGVCRLHCTKLNINRRRTNKGHVCVCVCVRVICHWWDQKGGLKFLELFIDDSVMLLEKYSVEIFWVHQLLWTGRSKDTVMSMGPNSYFWWRICSAYADVKMLTAGIWKILLHTKSNQTHSLPCTPSCNNNLLFEDSRCLWWHCAD
jgi:hypothetical protein